MEDPDAPHHEHTDQNGSQTKSRPQVGLQEDENPRDGHVEDTEKNETEAVAQLESLCEHRAQREDEMNFTSSAVCIRRDPDSANASSLPLHRRYRRPESERAERDWRRRRTSATARTSGT